MQQEVQVWANQLQVFYMKWIILIIVLSYMVFVKVWWFIRRLLAVCLAGPWCINGNQAISDHFWLNSKHHLYPQTVSYLHHTE